ncbi:MAG: hypothetical protein QN193_10600 [Armatimonadota bacterium]|nr:hypothetical protein [Armatimonadota bacterium]MDR7444676.1 hypothetical protein [Armatimonadota bacterium]MDR7571045.1 hypothetical protein [Armatimonadota bacterium]MDR7613615.1 hypothetical protein [Armatimonadota bacterium]
MVRFAAALAVLLLGSASLAQGSTEDGTVYICNEVAFRIRTAAAGQSIEQRREAVRLRLVQAYARGRITAAHITLRRVPGGWAISVGDQLLVTVTPADGQANGTTAAALARVWLGRLRDLLPRCRLEGPPDVRP